MQEFNQDNMQGYSDSELERINRKWNDHCEKLKLDQWNDPERYHTHCWHFSNALSRDLIEY